MQDFLPATAIAPGDLPRYVSSVLAQLHHGASEADLTSVLEPIARSLDADRIMLFELAKDNAATRVVRGMDAT